MYQLFGNIFISTLLSNEISGISMRNIPQRCSLKTYKQNNLRLSKHILYRFIYRRPLHRVQSSYKQTTNHITNSRRPPFKHLLIYFFFIIPPPYLTSTFIITQNTTVSSVLSDLIFVTPN